MGDDLAQVLAVDGGVTKALTVTESVRIKAAAANLHDLAFRALLRQRVNPDLPGHRRGMVKGVVEVARHDIQASVGRTGISRAERIKLLDGAVCVDHDQRARQQPNPLHLTGPAKDELDDLAEEADPCLLPGRAVPALEDADQPVRIPVARRGESVVGVWQQQVQRRRGELQQRFVRAHRVVLDVDRAQDAAVAVQELRRPQQVKASGDRVEAVTAVRVAPVPPGRVGVPVQADADLDPQALEDGKHRTAEEGAVGLEGHVHPGRHGGTERTDEGG